MSREEVLEAMGTERYESVGDRIHVINNPHTTAAFRAEDGSAIEMLCYHTRYVRQQGALGRGPSVVWTDKSAVSSFRPIVLKEGKAIGWEQAAIPRPSSQ